MHRATKEDKRNCIPSISKTGDLATTNMEKAEVLTGFFLSPSSPASALAIVSTSQNPKAGTGRTMHCPL